MNAPDKIFCWRGVLGTLFCSLKKGTNTDCTEYIRKDLLLEWANELTSEPYDRTTESAHKYLIANYLREKYNSL